MREQEREPAPLWRTFAVCVLLAGAAVALYSPVIAHPFINYDDPTYVSENPQVQEGLGWHTVAWALTATEHANWHPLTWISHALDCQFYGLAAAGHHASNVFLHALDVVLLFLLLSRATGFVWRSAMVAALFAVHPLNVESVAWVAERKNELSMLFFLLALGAYGWYAQQPNWKRYCGVAFLFTCGLASKPMVITLPCVLLLLDYWPLRRVRGGMDSSSSPSLAFRVPQTTWLRLVLEKVPLLILSLGSAIITILAQRSGNAVVGLGHLPFAVRAENALYSYTMYLAKMFWPTHLAVVYPHPLNKLTFLQLAVSAIFLMAVSGVVWRERVKRPYLLTGWLFFLGTMVPVLGLFQVGVQGMADRYFYLPGLGLFVMVVWGTTDLAEEHGFQFRMLGPLTACVLVALCALALRQLSYWRSSYDLWSHALQVTENNFLANDEMATLLLMQGRPEALQYYEAAAAITKGDPISHAAVASSLQDRGDFQRAIREYELVLQANPEDTLRANVYANLGVIYRQLGDYAKAREASQRALSLDPGVIQERIRHLSEMVAASPAAAGYFQLGLLLEGAGRPADARSAYEQSLRLDPQFDPSRRAWASLNGQ